MPLTLDGRPQGPIGAHNRAATSGGRAGGATRGIEAPLRAAALWSSKRSKVCPRYWPGAITSALGSLPLLAAVGGEAAPGGRVGGDLFLERLEIGGSCSRRGRRLGRRAGRRPRVRQRPRTGAAGAVALCRLRRLRRCLRRRLRLSRLLRRAAAGLRRSRIRGRGAHGLCRSRLRRRLVGDERSRWLGLRLGSASRWRGPDLGRTTPCRARSAPSPSGRRRA